MSTLDESKTKAPSAPSHVQQRANVRCSAWTPPDLADTKNRRVRSRQKERVAWNYSWSLCVNKHPSFVSPPSILFLLKACQRARSHSSLGSLSPEQFEAARRFGSHYCVSTESGEVHCSGSTSQTFLISSRHARDGMRRGLSAGCSMISIAALTSALHHCSAVAANSCAAFCWLRCSLVF